MSEETPAAGGSVDGTAEGSGVLKSCLRCGRLTPGSYCPDHARGGSTRAWRKVRTRALERDRYRCQACGKPATEVDHLIPVADGGPDVLANLQAVCSDCHQRLHH